MDDRKNQAARLRVFRDEVQDVVRLDFGPFLAAARRRDDEDDREALGEAETRGNTEAVNED